MGKLRLCHAARKIEQHVILHLIKGFRALELFAFLDIDIAELVGGFNVKTALDRAAGCQCDGYDQNIFFLTQGVVCKLSCLQGKSIGKK